MFETSPDLSVNTVAEIVRLALAPVFLLSGIGAFLNVLASRLSRIVDRTRDIEPQLLVSRGAEHDRWIAGLKVLDRRMSLINWATGLTVTSAVLTCLVVVLLFVGNNDYRLDLGAPGQRESLDDGELCVLVMRKKTRRGLIAASIRALFDRARRDDMVRIDGVERLRVDSHRSFLAVSLDGEVGRCEPPLDYKIRKQALTVIAP
jgi:hypothetical protein